MRSYGIEFNGKFLVVLNGIVVKKSFVRKEPALRWCLRYSANEHNYVELCYQNLDGFVTVLDYWN